MEVKVKALKIAVFRALHLGDTLCCIPAVLRLKNEFPHSEIHYVGLPSMASLLSRYAYIDQFLAFPGYPGLPEQETDMVLTDGFMQMLRQEQYDLLLQMQGNGHIVNNLLKKVYAKRLVGFCPDSRQAGQNWMVYPDNVHEIMRHLDLLAHIGISYHRYDTQIDYPLFEDDVRSYQRLKQQFMLQRYIVFHVGSNNVSRQWSLGNFAFLARYAQEKGYQVVCTGTINELERVMSFNKLMDNTCINLAGQTDLGSLGYLLKHADLLVSNCTGVSHIAAAMCTKSIIISLDGEPERWGPLDKTLHYTYDGRKVKDLFPSLLLAMDALLGV